jgi:DNA-binding transcriptional MerR regulator
VSSVLPVSIMATQRARKIAIDSSIIPDRLYFKIGDVARICDVKTYVLRFWESQFPQLKPNKSGNGQRLYRRRDVELALEIKRLVHGEGFTLAGARQVLEQRGRRTAPLPQISHEVHSQSQPTTSASTVIDEVRTELREIAGLLSANVPAQQRRRPRLVSAQQSPDDVLTLFPL